MSNISLEEKVVTVLKASSTAMANIAVDSKNNRIVRPAEILRVGDKYPMITVKVEDGVSEPVFPAAKQNLIITVWSEDNIKEPYKFLKEIGDIIVGLFNRKGDEHNDIDNNLRCLQFLKQSVTIDKDEEIKKFYCEIIFDVMISEGESFAEIDAGDISWI